MNADQSLITRVVASLEAELLLPIPVQPGWETSEKAKPVLVVSAEYGATPHPKLKTLALRIDLQTQRDDTADAQRQAYYQALDDHIEDQAQTIALAMVADGWQCRAWSATTPFSNPSEDRSWECGFEYRVVLMEV